MIDAKRLNEISGEIVDAEFHIHSEIGPGLIESVYEVLLGHEIRERGLRSERQKPVPIEYRGIRFDAGYRLDLVVADAVIVEIKSVECLLPVHSKQLLTYLRLTKSRLAYCSTAIPI